MDLILPSAKDALASAMRSSSLLRASAAVAQTSPNRGGGSLSPSMTPRMKSWIPRGISDAVAADKARNAFLLGEDDDEGGGLNTPDDDDADEAAAVTATVEPCRNSWQTTQTSANIDTTLGIIDASLSLWIKKIIALADGYLYSIVQGIRYLWLILLEITAPIAIALFFLSDKENNYKARFENWLVNMYSCYMLGIGFIIANFFSEVIRTKIWDHYQLDNVGVLILIIIIKITLYTTSKWASSRLL